MRSPRVSTHMEQTGPPSYSPVPPPTQSAAVDASQSQESAVQDRPLLTRADLQNSLLFGVVEACFAVVEYFVVIVAISALSVLILTTITDDRQSAFALSKCAKVESTAGQHSLTDGAENAIHFVWCLLSLDGHTMIVSTGVACLSSSFVLVWMLHRHLSPIANKIPSLPVWLGIKTPRFTWLGASILGYQIIATALLVFLQYQSGHWFMSLSNYLVEKKVDSGEVVTIVGYYKMANVLFLNPIKEELIFRGCIFYILYRRSKEVLPSIIVTNIIFGFFHLINMFGGHYSILYVLLQVLLGLEIGIFYSTRLLIVGSIWESLVLHIVNNLISSFLSTQQTSLFSEPAIVLALASTVVLYAVLNVHCFRQLLAMPQYNKNS